MSALPIEPPCDFWEEYELPKRCKARIEILCQDILKRGEDTNFSRIYDELYQLVKEQINDEEYHGFNY